MSMVLQWHDMQRHLESKSKLFSQLRSSGKTSSNGVKNIALTRANSPSQHHHHHAAAKKKKKSSFKGHKTSSSSSLSSNSNSSFGKSFRKFLDGGLKKSKAAAATSTKWDAPAESMLH